MNVIYFDLYKKENKSNMGDRCIVVNKVIDNSGLNIKLSLMNRTIVDVIPKVNSYEIDKWPYIVKAEDVILSEKQLSRCINDFCSETNIVDTLGSHYSLAVDKQNITYNNFVYSPLPLFPNRDMDIFVETGRKFYLREFLNTSEKEEAFANFESMDKNRPILYENEDLDELYSKNDIEELTQYVLEYFYGL